MRSIIRCPGWCAPRSVRCSWATSGPGTLRKLNPVEIAQLYKAVGL